MSASPTPLVQVVDGEAAPRSGGWLFAFIALVAVLLIIGGAVLLVNRRREEY